MYQIALKMLLANRGKYLGMVLSLAFTSLIMTQQPAVFASILTRTYGLIDDIAIADIWVMDPQAQSVDESKAMPDTRLSLVRSVSGVEWAVPLHKGQLKVRLPDGNTVGCGLIGVDDVSLIGAPGVMRSGSMADLRMSDAVVVDAEGASKRLAVQTDHGLRPLAVGDGLEVNDRRAVVVGVANATPTFQSQPILYTTFSRVKVFNKSERKVMSFVLVKAQPGQDHRALAARIASETGLNALTADDFRARTLKHFIKRTAIIMHFGTTILMSFCIGAVVTGLMFHNFTQDALRHFGVLKAMGTDDRTLLLMILSQALLVAGTGFGIGVGMAMIMGNLPGDPMGMRLSPLILAVGGGAVLSITLVSAALSIRQVLRLEPAVVFKQ
ncbi:ABC transporter permease [Nitratidesulfovibrio sp.]